MINSFSRNLGTHLRILTLVIEWSVSIHLMSTIWPSWFLEAFSLSQIESISSSKSNMMALSRDLYTVSFSKSSTFLLWSFTSDEMVFCIKLTILSKISKKYLYRNMVSLYILTIWNIVSHAANSTLVSLSSKLLMTVGKILSRYCSYFLLNRVTAITLNPYSPLLLFCGLSFSCWEPSYWLSGFRKRAKTLMRLLIWSCWFLSISFSMCS